MTRNRILEEIPEYANIFLLVFEGHNTTEQLRSMLGNISKANLSMKLRHLAYRDGEPTSYHPFYRLLEWKAGTPNGRGRPKEHLIIDYESVYQLLFQVFMPNQEMEENIESLKENEDSNPYAAFEEIFKRYLSILVKYQKRLELTLHDILYGFLEGTAISNIRTRKLMRTQFNDMTIDQFYTVKILQKSSKYLLLSKLGKCAIYSEASW